MTIPAAVRRPFIAVFGVFALGVAACHHAQPTPPSQMAPPRNGVLADNSVAEARARAEAARRDSIARADSTRRAAEAAERRARAAAAEAARAALTASIFFDYQRNELQPSAIAALDAKIPALRAHPSVRIRIEGNADDRGSGEYNQALGQRRSAAARRYLIAAGIGESRIDIVSFGEERPVCEAEVEPCWMRNRRDEFVIVAGGDEFVVRNE